MMGWLLWLKDNHPFALTVLVAGAVLLVATTGEMRWAGLGGSGWCGDWLCLHFSRWLMRRKIF